MDFKLHINCDNAAFEDVGHGVELARILRLLADRVEDWPGGNEFALNAYDINGNKVGGCEATV